MVIVVDSSCGVMATRLTSNQKIVGSTPAMSFFIGYFDINDTMM